MTMPGTDSTPLAGTVEAEAQKAEQRLSIGSQIDWSLAASTAKRFVRPGPKTTAYTYDAAQAELADAAKLSLIHISEPTRPY